MYNFEDLSMFRRCYIQQHKVYAQLVTKRRGIYNRLLNYMEYTDKNRCVVISGLMGEVYVMSLDEFQRKYMCARTQLPITDRHLEIMKSDWLEVEISFEQPQYYARFIPKNISFTIEKNDFSIEINNRFCEHGDGDFIVCEANNKILIEDSFQVVNGIVFANIFKCKELEEHYKNNRIIDKVPLPINNFV